TCALPISCAPEATPTFPMISPDHGLRISRDAEPAVSSPASRIGLVSVMESSHDALHPSFRVKVFLSQGADILRGDPAERAGRVFQLGKALADHPGRKDLGQHRSRTLALHL